MPHILFNGIKRKDVISISKSILKDLARICDTNVDNFIFDYIQSDWFIDGKEMKKYPLIEIKMFDRGREVEKNIFELINNELKGLNYEDIEVYFIHLNKDSYYF